MIILMPLIGSFNCIAQDVLSDSLSEDSSEFVNILPSLDKVIDTAITLSPLLEQLDVQKEISSRDMRTEKRWFLKSFGVSAGYNYGNTGVLSVSESGSSDPTNSFSTTTNARFLVGTNVNISLYTFIDRNNLIKRKKLEIDKWEYEKEIMKRLISQEITANYYKVILAHKLLVIASERMETADVNEHMAHKLFSTGEMSLEDISRISEAYIKAKADFEKSKVDYEVALLLLEQNVGTKMKYIK